MSTTTTTKGAGTASASDGEKKEETTKTTTTQEGGKSAAAASSSSSAPEPPTVPEGHALISEGLARMIHPSDANTVFYNPVQVQNRDLSVLMIAMYAERRLRRFAIKGRKKELLDELRGRGGVPQKEWDVEGLERRAEEEMKGVDWSSRARESSKTEGGMRILEALAASGLRSVRYWREIPGVRQVVINDLEEAAVELGRKNVEFNGLNEDLCRAADPTLGGGEGDASNGGEEGEGKGESYYDGVRVQQSDATHEMYLSRRPPTLSPRSFTPAQRLQHPQYDVIDLDPYGSASPFLDAACQSVRHGGLLAVTCTDMAALGGSHPETCYGRYGGSMPVQRGGYLQELALRILIKDCALTAARYGRTVRPVLSVGMAFYVRIFLEVYDDKKGVNDLSLQIGNVYQSAQCPTFYTSPHGTYGKRGRKVYQPTRIPEGGVCGETGGPFKVAGPCWLGPLHDLEVVEEAVRRLELPPNEGTTKSEKNPIVHPFARSAPLHGLLTSVTEELPDVPLYYTVPNLCKTVRCEAVPLKLFRAALHNAGYRSSAYHKEPEAIKTDAPPEVVWDVIREWCKSHPPRSGKNKKESNAERGKERKERRKEERKRQQREKRRGGGKGEEDNGNDESNGTNKNSGGGGDDNDDNDEKKKDKEKKKDQVEEGETPSQEAAAPPHPGELILAKEMTIKVDFTVPPGFGEGRKKAQRYPQNPSKNWGPKPKALGMGMAGGSGSGSGGKAGGGGDEGDERAADKEADAGGDASGKKRKAPEGETEDAGTASVSAGGATETEENAAAAGKKKKKGEDEDEDEDEEKEDGDAAMTEE